MQTAEAQGSLVSWSPEVVVVPAVGWLLRNALFPAMWLFIGSVSAYDAFLTIRFEDEMNWQEQNPLGSWLLELDGGKSAVLVGVKFVGTILVLGVLNIMHRCNMRWATLVTAALAAFQFGLLAFLTMA